MLHQNAVKRSETKRAGDLPQKNLVTLVIVQELLRILMGLVALQFCRLAKPLLK